MYKCEFTLANGDDLPVFVRTVVIPFVPRKEDVFTGLDRENEYRFEVADVVWNCSRECFEVDIEDGHPSFFMSKHDDMLMMEILGEGWVQIDNMDLHPSNNGTRSTSGSAFSKHSSVRAISRRPLGSAPRSGRRGTRPTFGGGTP